MKLARYTPDMKIVVGVIAAAYVSAVVFSLVPQLSPGNVAGKLITAKAK